MRSILFLSLILSLVLVSGCGRNETASTPLAAESEAASKDLSPEQLGELGAQIKKEPNRAAEILAEHGLNEESFEAKIREVTQDPEASKRYTAAYNRASA